MTSLKIKVNEYTLFDICISVINNHNDYTVIEYSDDELTIHVKKKGGFLAYGYDINISINNINSSLSELIIESDTTGIQIFSWGTNKDNEEELAELISEQIR